ncbi:hypothetical protein GW796_10555 [archaeon]|nr:hypothetical protein [archaeon]
MFGILNKLSDKLLSSKSKVHYFQPKSINIYFKNSVNPEFKILNLTNLSSVSFFIENFIIENTDTNYVLVVKLNNEENNIMELATFKTIEEANEALQEIRCKLYMPVKSITKWVVMLSVAMVFWSLTAGFISGFTKNKELAVSEQLSATLKYENPSVKTVESGLPQVAKNPDVPAMSEGDLKQMIENLQNQQNGGGVSQSQQLESQQVPQAQEQLSPSDKLLKGLN